MRIIVGKFLLFLAGWKVNPVYPKEAQRCVMIAAPHTSNWDAYFVMISFMAMGIPVKFTIKNDWMRFPFGMIIRSLGGLGIDRSPKKPGEIRKSQVEIMADLIKERDRIAMVVAIEGTRSPTTKWRQGFYYTAIKAEVPITFGYLDYKKKEAGVGGPLYPSGDFDADMKIITEFYRNIAPKYPEMFKLDERYQ